MKILPLIFTALLIADASAATLLLKNAQVHTISGEILTEGDVLIEGKKIVRVEENLDVAADQTIDLKGKRLYPGLIATSTSLGLLEIGCGIL